MLTVKVCCEMLARPMTAGPVLISVGWPSTVSAIVVCAGQYRSGVHCTTLLSSHSYLPAIAGVDVIWRARSAARRLATGARKVTTTGCATPTTWPRAGRSDAIGNAYDSLAAARLTSAGTGRLTM